MVVSWSLSSGLLCKLKRRAVEAVSKTGWLADVLLEIAGMSLAASPTEGVSPLVLRFRALFCLFSFPSP